MIKPHAPLQGGSKHAANEYCPTCHGAWDPSLWDSEGRPIQSDSQNRLTSTPNPLFSSVCEPMSR
jgi:hypothetical protein